MNRETMRMHQQRLKKMSLSEFKEEMNILHSRAYRLAGKHYSEAMDIILTPKQKAAVIAKANEIRETWDGIHEVGMDDTHKGA
jgi:hypothetical protein